MIAIRVERYTVVGYATVKPRIIERNGVRAAVFDSPGDDGGREIVILDSVIRRCMGKRPMKEPRPRRMPIYRAAPADGATPPPQKRQVRV
jgi:hypothetical protein